MVSWDNASAMSADGLVAISDALGRKVRAKIAVKISCPEPDASVVNLVHLRGHPMGGLGGVLRNLLRICSL
jgi:hypothetical protein